MSAPVPILYRDDRLVIVSKPAGMPSIDDGSASGPALPEQLAALGLHVLPVHRLDRDVSGAVLFAFDAECRGRLEEMFRARALKKLYWALAQGLVKPAAGTFHDPIVEDRGFARVSALGKKSITNYRTIAAFVATTEVEIELVTGRYNQIRVHFAHAGFPLVGERKYARGKDSPVHFKSRRVALHAARVAFAHPYSGLPIDISAALPDDLLELRERAAST